MYRIWGLGLGVWWLLLRIIFLSREKVEICPVRKFLSDMFTLDLRSLALLRVGVASVLIYDLLERWQDVEAHYSDVGILPREALWKYFSSWNLTFHSMSGYWEIQAVLFSIAMVFAIMLLFGFKTRLATIVSWIFLISLQNRNPVICYGGDSVLRMLLFWGMFIPWGARFAADAVRFGTQKVGNRIRHAGTLGYIVQILCIYVFTAILKDGAEWREDFTAVYYALSLDELKTGLTDWLFGLGEGTHKFLTVSVLWWEFLGPLLLLIPKWRVRLLGVLGFIALHIGFGSFMRLGIFPFVSCVCVLGFIPGGFWDWFGKKKVFDRQRSTTIFYDGTCGFCHRMSGLIRTFLVLPNVNLRAAGEDSKAYETMEREHSWVIRDESGEDHIRFAGFLALLEVSPLWRWLYYPLRIFLTPGNKVYTQVTRFRDRYTVKNREKPLPLLNLRPLGSALAAFSIVFVIAINLVVVYEDQLKIPPGLSAFAKTSKITQNWGMFAPYPYKSDGWYVIPGELMNGDRLDLFTENQNITFDKPERVSAMFKTTRWSKYYRSLRRGKYRKLMPYYIKYLVRDWNRNHPQEQWISEFRMVFVREKTLPDYQVSDPEEIVLWRYKRPERTN